MKKKKKNFIKIISGILKNQKIYTPKTNLLRPTTNYIKETLFNWLMFSIKNSTCLDCFSGSGSLAIESISRGAKKITAIEKNFFFIKYLKKNLLRLKIKNFFLIHNDCIKWLKNNKSFAYDIVFLDPPYSNIKLLNNTINLINKRKWIKKNSLIYIEKKNDKKKIYVPKKWTLLKLKKTKNIQFQLFLKI
ncbi:16S rRNA (guanine(966)-N(2))-methyltransferase RsmD [Buchnera aphidicola]|uniref:16S rRNA (guanine(966)-N(2))-methyltransferase RsmD n=1 Tax=Buchnera aphidicola TaxID=9 RepID=UPI0030EE8674